MVIPIVQPDKETWASVVPDMEAVLKVAVNSPHRQVGKVDARRAVSTDWSHLYRHFLHDTKVIVNITLGIKVSMFLTTIFTFSGLVAPISWIRRDFSNAWHPETWMTKTNFFYSWTLWIAFSRLFLTLNNEFQKLIPWSFSHCKKLLGLSVPSMFAWGLGCARWRTRPPDQFDQFVLANLSDDQIL